MRDRNLLHVSFAALAIVLVAVFAVRWIRKRPDWSEVGVAIGVGLAYWMAFIRIENPAERTHLLEYGIVAALIHMALQERARNGRPVPNPAALTVVATALLGLLDECIQALIPGRFFDWIDVGFNAFAGFIVVAARLAQEPAFVQVFGVRFGVIPRGIVVMAGNEQSGRPEVKFQLAVKGPQAVPEMPPELDGKPHAKAVWQLAVEALPHVLRPLDGPILTASCLAFQTAIEMDSSPVKKDQRAAASYFRLFEILASRNLLRTHRETYRKSE